MDEVYKFYKCGDFDIVIIQYLYVAEQGNELAQSDLAYIIDKGKNKKKKKKLNIYISLIYFTIYNLNI